MVLDERPGREKLDLSADATEVETLRQQPDRDDGGQRHRQAFGAEEVFRNQWPDDPRIFHSELLVGSARLLLHATALELAHPITGALLCLNSAPGF